MDMLVKRTKEGAEVKLTYSTVSRQNLCGRKASRQAAETFHPSRCVYRKPQLFGSQREGHSVPQT